MTIASIPDLRAMLAAAAFALACGANRPEAPAPARVGNVTPIAPAVRIPEIYVRAGNDIVLAPEADQAIAQTYARSAHGEVSRGLRMTILTERTRYRVGEPVRVLHVVEAVDPSASAWVMGPKPVFGEYIDGVSRTARAEVPDYPWVGVYDGAVLPGPAADFNFEITSYTFATPGRHVIDWRLGELRSNAIAIDVQ